MHQSPTFSPRRTMPVLGTLSDDVLPQLSAYSYSFASQTWPAASRAIFIPFLVHQLATAVKLWWTNGASVSGNVDAGIYDLAGNLLVSVGGTAQSGTNVVQLADITDTPLPPGRYMQGLVLDNTTGTISIDQSMDAMIAIAWGLQQMASAYPLPNPATFAALTASASTKIPNFGVQFQSQDIV